MNYFLVLSKSVLLIVQKLMQSDFGQSLESRYLTAFNLGSWTGADGLTQFFNSMGLH